MCLPFDIDYERVYEFVVNNDFQKLVFFELKGLNEEKEHGTMGKLFRTILMKKKHFLGLLWKGSILNTQILLKNEIMKKGVLGLLI